MWLHAKQVCAHDTGPIARLLQSLAIPKSKAGISSTFMKIHKEGLSPYFSNAMAFPSHIGRGRRLKNS